MSIPEHREPEVLNADPHLSPQSESIFQHAKKMEVDTEAASKLINKLQRCIDRIEDLEATVEKEKAERQWLTIIVKTRGAKDDQKDHLLQAELDALDNLLPDPMSSDWFREFDLGALTSAAEGHLYRIRDSRPDWELTFGRVGMCFARVLHARPRLFPHVRYLGSTTHKWVSEISFPPHIDEECIPDSDWEWESDSGKEKDKEKEKEQEKEREEDPAIKNCEDEKDWGHFIDKLEQLKTKGGKKTKKDSRPKPKPNDGNGWIETRQAKRGKQYRHGFDDDC